MHGEGGEFERRKKNENKQIIQSFPLRETVFVYVELIILVFVERNPAICFFYLISFDFIHMIINESHSFVSS